MSLVVLRHRKDRELSDRTLVALNPSRPLVYGREVGVEVTRIAAPPRDFLARSRHLAQGLAIVGHVGQDHQDVHAQIVGEVLSGRQRHSGRCDPLDGRVIRKVDEEHGALDGACALEVGDEEVRLLECNAHRPKDHRELLLSTQHPGLPRDLSRDARMRQARARKNRQFLPAHECVKPVNGGYACLDKLRRIVARVRVYGGAVGVEPGVWYDLGAIVARAAQSVEDPS
ncbi:MAG: hypothetical protein BWY92_01369 [Firmicutes bacterium ADurb.BinA052]|nr:MAG: hypothetical protein BWY92_01369 [Firmicutes bacterium ADurb.BinA052]